MEQELSARFAKIDSIKEQDARIKGYQDLVNQILDAKKFASFKNIVNHRNS